MDNQLSAEDEDGFHLPDYFPILTTFATAKARVHTLSALGELSFLAGRDGDEPHLWNRDMDEAIAKAYGALRRERREQIKGLLRQSYNAGAVHYELDRLEVPANAMELARAYALIYETDIEFECERLPISNHWEAWKIAYRLACRLNVSPKQSVKAAITALEERGLRCLPTWVADLVARAHEGQHEREERIARSGRETDTGAALLDQIFAEEAGQ